MLGSLRGVRSWRCPPGAAAPPPVAGAAIIRIVKARPGLPLLPVSCRVLCNLAPPSASATSTPPSSSSSVRPKVPFELPQLPLHKVLPKSRASQARFLPPVTLSIMHSHAHGGHGHHHHHHDNTYLVSSNKNDAGVRITRIGLYVNLGMAVTKGIGGVMFNSQALVADAWHALTDLVSDFLTLATISVALKPPTSKYPYGFGKVESFGSLLVSGLLLIGGLVMAKHSAESLYLQMFTDAAHHAHDHAHHAHDHEHSHGFFSGLLGHSHSAHDMIPDIKAAWLAAGSIIVKEWLYRATKKIAKERKSAVLDSNAVHHRVDSLTSLVALLAIGGANIWESATWLDPVGGLIVSVMIVQAGWGNTGSAIRELCDASIDDEVKQSVKKAATKGLLEDGKDYQIRSVEGVKAGQNFLVDVELAVPSNLQLFQLTDIEETVRSTVGNKVRGVRRVRVKFVSEEGEVSDFTGEFIPGDVSPRSSPEPEEHDHDHDHEHDHDHDHGHSKSSGKAANGNGNATKRR